MAPDGIKADFKRLMLGYVDFNPGLFVSFQKDNETVFVEAVTSGVESLSRVWMEPLKEDDWEILVSSSFVQASIKN